MNVRLNNKTGFHKEDLLLWNLSSQQGKNKSVRRDVGTIWGGSPYAFS